MIHSLSLIFRQWLIQFWSLLSQIAAAVAIFAVMLVLTNGNPSEWVIGSVFFLTIMTIMALEIKQQGFSGRKESSPKGKKRQVLKSYLTIFRPLGARFLGDMLRGADLSGVNLSGVNLSGVNLSGADLSGAAPPWYRYQMSITGSGSDRSRTDLVEANRSETDLSRTNLSGANLSGTNLNEANLFGANLSGANLFGANLSGANLNKANLSDAYLFSANLSDAYLFGANLSGANLSGANLSGAYFSGAYLSDAANFASKQIKAAKNWESAFYDGKRLDDPEVSKLLGLDVKP